jgi:hypothetical protein
MKLRITSQGKIDSSRRMIVEKEVSPVLWVMTACVGSLVFRKMPSESLASTLSEPHRSSLYAHINEPIQTRSEGRQIRIHRQLYVVRGSIQPALSLRCTHLQSSGAGR